LVFTNGLYYKKFTDVPFTGEVTGKGQGSVRNRKKDGPWVWYYDNGRIEKNGTYKDGKRDGPWVGYNSEETVIETLTGTFKDGENISD
jgi:antitoxin component YwqK of YwqJK toxin-antitoxin module